MLIALLTDAAQVILFFGAGYGLGSIKRTRLQWQLVAGWLATPVLSYLGLLLWVNMVPELKHSMVGMAFVIFVGLWLFWTGLMALGFLVRRIVARNRVGADNQY